MDGTAAFYDADPEGYSDATFGSDVSGFRMRFAVHIPEGGRILDLGCGSGRDTVAFREMGFDVVPVDGSEGMCRVAERNTGSPVTRMDIRHLCFKNEFDGVWACASLLHIPSAELPNILFRISASLKDGGVLYMSFKKGSFEGTRDGRHYTDMTCGGLEVLSESCGMEVLDLWESRDSSRDVEWVNAIVRPAVRR